MVDDYVVHKGDPQNITFNLVQFQVDILGVLFDSFKILFQKKWISVRIDCSKDYSNKSNSVSLLKCYDVVRRPNNRLNRKRKTGW